MKTFIEFLTEKLIVFGGKRPKYDNVVIMAGGAASGKGFILNNLIGIEGKTFDVDHLKSLAMKAPLLSDRVKKEFGVELNKLNLKNSKDVFTLHTIISELRLNNKILETFLKSTLTSKNKPNIIFDVTLKSLSKLESIAYSVEPFGYKKQNTHIVWVVNDLDSAIQQNLSRDRRVPEDILKDTHKHVALTMKNILGNGSKIKKYMDGDIWVVFNKQYVDSLMVSSDFGGKYIKDAIYFKVKEKGKDMKTIDDISSQFIKKIEDYAKIKFK